MAFFLRGIMGQNCREGELRKPGGINAAKSGRDGERDVDSTFLHNGYTNIKSYKI